MPITRICAVVALLIGSAGCGRKAATVAQLSDEFIRTTFRFSPVMATAAGYRMDNTVSLDELLDSFDEAELKKQRDFYTQFRDRLDDADEASLSPEDRADLRILKDQTELYLTEFATVQSYKHNPTLYVELVGSALFTPLVVEYAPIEQRYKHIIERLKKVPQLLGQARQNLTDAPELWTKIAARENDGNRDLIIRQLAEKCPYANRTPFGNASAEALKAIDSFTEWLNNDLAKRKSDWRLGEAKYAAKLGPVLGLGLSPKQVLADAEAELARVRAEMAAVAGPLHEKMFPKDDRADANKMVRQVLGKIAERHATRESYFDDAGRDLEEARAFTKAKQLVGLPTRDNLKVIPTPEFMRGIYAVGGFSPAPALQPDLGAFYWLTPIPGDWDATRVDSKLREYNFWGLKLLTIHEAIPGHYLQYEYANSVEPRTRRLLRAVFANGPYVEGWAVYATEAVIEAGYLDNDPQLKLTWQKQYLRAVANAILDVRLHTLNMTDEAAMDLMVNQTFQEQEEATAKLQRAKLSSTQLPTYFTGYRAWIRLRDKVRQARGAAYSPAAFHEQALKTGAVPMPALDAILNVR